MDFITLIQALSRAKLLKEDRIPAEIFPEVYLGSYGAAHNKALLKQISITHIPCVASSIKAAFPELLTYKSVETMRPTCLQDEHEAVEEDPLPPGQAAVRSETIDPHLEGEHERGTCEGREGGQTMRPTCLQGEHEAVEGGRAGYATHLLLG
ncbi:Mitogen-activated protein kinase 2, partial [Cymbomonas tetramitiformis]